MKSDFVKKQKEGFVKDMEMSGKLENCVANEGGKLKVNWDNLASLRTEEPIRYSKILRYLSNKDVLTTSPQKGLMLVGAGVLINPTSLMTPTTYYFTTEKDAESFARANHKNPIYEITLNNFHGVLRRISF